MTTSPTIRLATRASKLALWQANHVATALNAAGYTTQLVALSTAGDRTTDRPLHEIGGKGLFIKELEQALLDGEADLAVHSLKDLPVQLNPNFRLAALLERHAAEDVLVIRPGSPLVAARPRQPIPREEPASWSGAVIATGSLRRTALLSHFGPGVQVRPLRGNVDTRLRKMEEMGWDGIILARAGLERLGLLDGLLWRPLDPSFFIPSPAQGAIAIETLAGSPLAETLAALHAPRTAALVMAERWLLEALGGDCTVPLGCHLALADDGASITGRAVFFDGAGVYHVSEGCSACTDDLCADALKLAQALHQQLEN